MSRLNSQSFPIWQQVSHAVWAGGGASAAGKAAVYVDLFHESIDYLIYSLHIGRLIGLEAGLPVIGLSGKLGVVHGSCPGFSFDEVTAIARGFDVEVVHLAESPLTGAAIDWVTGEALRQGVTLPDLSGEKLRRFLRAAHLGPDFPIGRYIYDTHLRNRKSETILDFDVSLLEDIERCLNTEREIGRELDARPAAWFVAGHIDYAPWGVIADRVLARGGRVAYFRNEGRVRIHLVSGVLQEGETIIGRIRRTGAPMQSAMIDRLVAEMPDIGENHFRAASTGARFRSHRFVDAPMANLSASSSRRIERAIRARLGIDDGRPVVGAFSITFSDIPLADEQVFEDNYHWLLETLAFAAGRPDIHWLVKIHPADLAYNTTGAMARLTAQFAAFGHIHFIEQDWSPATVIAACDVVTSVRGSPGLQAAAMGRPAVFCGHGQYSGFGFGILASTKDEYFHVLTDLAHSPRQSENDTARARAFQYLEDVVFANVSSFLGSFGELSASTDPWSDMATRLRWYAPETDPLCRAIGEAIREDLPRVSGASLTRDGQRPISSPVAQVERGGLSVRNSWPPGMVPLYGFYPTEPWGVWMGADPAALVIRVAAPSSGVLRLRMTCKTLIPPEWPAPSMSIAVDGVEGNTVLADDQAPDELVFDIGSATFGEDGQLLVEFTPGIGTIPNDVCHNGDGRHLTFSFRDISWRLLPAEDQPPQCEPNTHTA